MSKRKVFDGKPLSPRDAEILQILAEECAEVVQECMKILRFGVERVPGSTLMNVDKLALEMGQVRCMMALAIGERIVAADVVDAGMLQKRDNLAQYMRHLPGYVRATKEAE